MIADYSDLAAEVTKRSGDVDFANRAGMLVGMAETYIRQRMHIGTVSFLEDFEGLESASTNWLLQQHPELYMQAVLFQLYQSKGDVEKGALNKSLADESINTLLFDAKIAWVNGRTLV